MKAIFPALLVFTGIAHADPQPWMKQEDPNSLGLYVTVNTDCLFTEQELTEVAEGEFLRSRIKATRSLDLNLTINIICMKVTSKNSSSLGSTVHYEIRYGTLLSDGNVLYEIPNYGSMLVGDDSSKQFFIGAIRESITKAITDYLKANFE
jgi:hypothetical protein